MASLSDGDKLIPKRVRSESKGGLQLAFGLSYIFVPYLLLQEVLVKQTGGRPVRRAQGAAQGEGGSVLRST